MDEIYPAISPSPSKFSFMLCQQCINLILPSSPPSPPPISRVGGYPLGGKRRPFMAGWHHRFPGGISFLA